MIRSTKNEIRILLINRRTFKMLICILLSVLLWVLIRLSKNLQREFSVDISITNVPENMFLKSSQTHQIKILAEGKGYALFKYYSGIQELSIDFNDLEHIEGKKYKLSTNIANKLNSSYSSELKIQNTYSDTIYVDLQKKYTKKIPVEVDLNADFQKEYQLTEMIVQPDSVIVSGAKSVIDTLKTISISFPLQKNVKSSFEKSYHLKNTDCVKFDKNKIIVKAIVDKMSEQLIKIPVQLLNIPEGSQIKIFPTEVTILCSGDLNILKKITSDEITVIADYNNVQNNKYLPLTIRTKLKRVKLSFLNENKVDFLIRKI